MTFQIQDTQKVCALSLKPTSVFMKQFYNSVLHVWMLLYDVVSTILSAAFDFMVKNEGLIYSLI